MFILLIFLITFYLKSLIVLEEKKLEVRLIVGDNPGFDVNSTALTLGKILPGDNAQRNILLKNNYQFPIKAEISVQGNVKDFLLFQNPVFIKVGEEKKIGVIADIPVNAEKGNYSGEMIVRIKPNVFFLF